MKALDDLAFSTNRECPVQVDEITTPDSMRVDPVHRIIHEYYSVASPVDSLDTEGFGERIEPKALRWVKGRGRDLYLMRKAKVTFRYTWLDINGELIYKTDITPKMYRQ